MNTASPATPRRFAVLPLEKRVNADRPAVRRFIIVPATQTPVAGVRAP